MCSFHGMFCPYMHVHVYLLYNTIQATALDPLLDDSVAMAHRLQSLGQAVTLNVVENVPHGFLCFKSAGNDQDLEAGQRLCMDYMRQGLDTACMPSSHPHNR